MLETMYDAKGIGLAATQIDVHERVIVIDVSEEHDSPLVLINPELAWTSAETHLNEEGCLSVPGIYDGVQRFDAVHVRALDLQGQARTIEAEELLAVYSARNGSPDGQGVCGIPLAPQAQPHQKENAQGAARGRTVRAIQAGAWS
jgi:hypothetical protein